ncbi:MAG TPA: sigma 54-interacting transcriptional regulator [Polyangiaceae bacterium]
MPSPRETSEASTRATTMVRDDAPHRRRLLVFWKHGSATFDLPDAGAVVVGRGRECDVRIDHASVSRKHARFHLGRRVAVEDLGSSNGTVVGGKPIARGEIATIEPGVVVELGSAMLLVQGGDADRAGAPVGESTAPTGDDEPRPPRTTRMTEPPPGPVPVHARADVIVEDAAMQRLYRLAELVAKSTISVILLGETGVGKEVLAETIHRKSPRARGPFVRLNCAALPDNLLESELFGFERGAFTGAVAPKPGLLEAAHGGTVFLDEVGELPLPTQAKLLRVLESGEVSRLGSLKPRPIDVRFLSATNRDLESLVPAAFRQDLYYRLNGISIHVPPLRERRGEIRALARAFLRDACRKAGRAELSLTPAALARLEAHTWPGNVRELRNVLERAALLCPEEAIDAEHVMLGTTGAPPREMGPPPPSKPLATGSGDDEKQRIVDALEKCGGNQKEAAKVLGISRRTLVYRLDAYGLPRPRKRGADK